MEGYIVGLRSEQENDDKWKLNFILLLHVLSHICVAAKQLY